MAKPRTIISIDSNTIFRILLIGLGILFLYYVRNVLVIAFVAFIIVSAIAPVVDFLERFYLPRSIVTLAIYAIFLSALVYLFSLLAPAVGEQIKQLAHNLPAYGQQFSGWQEKIQYLSGSKLFAQQDKSQLLLNLGNRLSEGGLNIFTQAGSFLKGILSFLAVFSLSFYLSIQKKTVGSFLRGFIPKEHQEYAVLLMDRIQKKMGHWLVVFAFAVGIMIGMLYYLRTNEGRKQWDLIVISVPIFGTLLRSMYMNRFADNLGLLLRESVPITRSLEITAKIMGNHLYEKVLLNCIKEVQRGSMISAAIEESPYFPSVVPQILRVGEESGRTAETLAKIADYYNKEVNNMTQNMMALIEPVLILFLGAGVAIIVASVIMPIYNMAGSI